ncbi:MAG: hypothetical protein L0Y57_05120, partial [Beijerinckiaceae bacterium]|nr:hypothetical protein [Beijerinckiaceae bacterium]
MTAARLKRAMLALSAMGQYPQKFRQGATPPGPNGKDIKDSRGKRPRKPEAGDIVPVICGDPVAGGRALRLRRLPESVRLPGQAPPLCRAPARPRPCSSWTALD